MENGEKSLYDEVTDTGGDFGNIYIDFPIIVANLCAKIEALEANLDAVTKKGVICE